MIPLIFLNAFFMTTLLGALFTLLIGTALILNHLIKTAKKRYFLYTVTLLLIIGGNILTVVELGTARFTTDFSQPFPYMYMQLSSKTQNITRAAELHAMVISLGIRDPFGFFFNDFPNTSIPYRRMISIIPYSELTDTNDAFPNASNMPYYYVKTKTVIAPTLLMVPKSLLLEKNLPLLKHYIFTFLNIPKNAESRVQISAYKESDATGAKWIEAWITFLDNQSSDAVKLVINYNLLTGFGSTNVIYTTRHYVTDKPSTIYLESVYQLLEAEIHSVGFFLGFISLIAIPISSVFVYGIILSRKTHKNDITNHSTLQTTKNETT